MFFTYTYYIIIYGYVSRWIFIFTFIKYFSAFYTNPAAALYETFLPAPNPPPANGTRMQKCRPTDQFSSLRGGCLFILIQFSRQIPVLSRRSAHICRRPGGGAFCIPRIGQACDSAARAILSLSEPFSCCQGCYSAAGASSASAAPPPRFPSVIRKTISSLLT